MIESSFWMWVFWFRIAPILIIYWYSKDWSDKHLEPYMKCGAFSAKANAHTICCRSYIWFWYRVAASWSLYVSLCLCILCCAFYSKTCVYVAHLVLFFFISPLKKISFLLFGKRTRLLSQKKETKVNENWKKKRIPTLNVCLTQSEIRNAFYQIKWKFHSARAVPSMSIQFIS